MLQFELLGEPEDGSMCKGTCLGDTCSTVPLAATLLVFSIGHHDIVRPRMNQYEPLVDGAHHAPLSRDLYSRNTDFGAVYRASHIVMVD